MASQDKTYREALKHAEAELLGLEEYVRTRKATLQKSISSLRELLGDSVPSPVTEEFSEDESLEAASPLKIWQRVEVWLDGNGHPFSVKQALAGLEKIGHPIQGPNKFQIMRQALKKKPEMFEHDQHSGMYRLITPQ